MRFLKIISLSIVFYMPVIGQVVPEQKGIHQLHWEQYSTDTADFNTPDKPVEGLIPLQPRLSKSALSTRVFGFLPDWEYPEAMNNLRFDLLTHIAAFDFVVNENGQISNPARWPWTDLINQAHSEGVKVILTAVTFDGFVVNTLINNSTSRTNFFNNLKNKIRAYNLDGVNIDFESFYENDRGAPINNFMAELTAFMHDSIPGSEVSFDGPAVNWGDHWDFNGLAASCDYIFIMGYAFAGSWSDYSGSTAPLKGGTYNISNTVKVEYADVTFSTPEKLILGVPYYGHEWQTVNGDAGSAVSSFEGSRFYRSAASGFENYGTRWDSFSASPWYRFQSGGNWYQVWCENERSIDEKFDLADTYALGGVGMWALNYDGNKNEFWEVIRRHYASDNPVLPYEPRGLSLLRRENGDLQVSYQAVPGASGYRVYYGTDGLTFNDSLLSIDTTVVMDELTTGENYFVKVRAINNAGRGPATGVLAGTAGSAESKVLIVDGFDRTSGTTNTRDYIRRHAASFADLEIAFSSCTNEAVENGLVALEDFDLVNWFLGDESTTNDTFSPAEQARVKAFLEAGGHLLVSGAEIGWDLSAEGDDNDAAFYRDYLKAQYVADAPNNQKSTYYSAEGISSTPFSAVGTYSFDDGSQGTFDVDWPDAIKGAAGGMLGFKFNGVSTSSGGAGVYYSGVFGDSQTEGRLVHLSVPLETVYPQEKRSLLLEHIVEYLQGASSLPGNDDRNIAQDFKLLPNYPNPFNPTTTIRLVTASAGIASISIYDSKGSKIMAVEKESGAGKLNWVWDGNDAQGRAVASGLYLYRVVFETKNGRRYSAAGRMTLIR